jgi:hypothetical protein
MVEVTLRFLIEQVGRVEGVFPVEGRLAGNFLIQRGAGNGIELLGFLTINVSPVWVLAALADATGTGHALIQQIAGALKEEGLLDRESRFETMDQLLDGLEKTSAHLANTLNQPPLDIAGLRTEWTQLREKLPTLPPGKLPRVRDLEDIWLRLVKSAEAQNRSVFTVCSTIAVTALTHVPANLLWLSRAAAIAAKRTGEILGETLLQHYVQSLEEINRVGFVEYWKCGFRPYLKGAAELFLPANESTTEKLLRRRSQSYTK